MPQAETLSTQGPCEIAIISAKNAILPTMLDAVHNATVELLGRLGDGTSRINSFRVELELTISHWGIDIS